MTRITERVIAALLVLFLLSYVAYQSYRYFYNPIQTETVFEYTVAHTIDVTGIAVREEAVIPFSSGGIENYVFEDGERVTLGQTVAEFYENSVSDRNIKRMRELEQEIAMLTEAQNPVISNFSNAESLVRDIKEQLGTIGYMSSIGQYGDAQSVKESITSLLSKRQVATGKESDYQQRIAELSAELEQLTSISTAASLEVATAPVSGYFVKEVDGLESIVTTDAIGNLDIAGYRALIEQGENIGSVSGTVGKIVTSQNWYYVVLVPKYDIQWIRDGQSVNLRFDTITDIIPGTVEEILQENEEDDAALVIKCSRVSGELFNLRSISAQISFQQYTGLRINTADIRFSGEEQGVYVLSRNTVYFKKIDPVYEESSFIISQPSNNPQDTDTVKLFDQVITKGGKDLYHGKVIE